jgi:hypothetical protein
MRDYSEVSIDIRAKINEIYRLANEGDREAALKLAVDLKILSTELIQSLLSK